MEKHGHRCGICGISEEATKGKNGKTKHYGLYIGHCHTTHKLRRLLYHNCNLVIGHANDDINILNNAINYLT